MMQYPAFNPIAVQIGPWQIGPLPINIQIRWYGLMYVLSFMLAYFLIQKQAKRQKLDITADDVSDVLFYLILGVLLGGRVGYILFYNFQQYIANPLEILAIWHGGMSFHGGLIGVAVATALYVRKKHLDFWHLADVLVPAVPFGLLLGRMGNFINGELWGRPTTVSWGMVFPADPYQLVRHPSQLYEAFFEGLVAGVVIWAVASMPKRPRGLIPGLFITLYGVARFFIEYYREPDAQLGLLLGGTLSMGQILCLAMVVIGLGLMAYVTKRGVPADAPTHTPPRGTVLATADGPIPSGEMVAPDAEAPPSDPPSGDQPAHGT
ncbi:MAG: prolipoprotein diacylglyceryl transferase [Candidatus Sericytochromatia bacterium]|nr:prolipoprotein diacylglyceryl transferase [Candidatus Sericytochromatia bacterium]